MAPIDGIVIARNVSVGQTVRVNAQLELSSVSETVRVTGNAPLVETASNALGRVVTGRELVDLPLNGRNFTQLGLLQTGVAPLTAGVAAAGGSLRQGQAYAVNGMRPEQNMYLVDGAQNQNRMDGGYALKLPVEAIAEFRILTQTAPPEYGGTAGATTSVVTRSGTNQLHGAVYEFVRNDAFDARNFFSAKVEPLNQHQFGGTFGGPIVRDRALFFGYYEGFRNEQGLTTTATVPTLVREWTRVAERAAHAPILVVGPGVRTGIPIRYDDPREVGPDRIVNAVAARARYGAPVIVVDFGTSTNFDVVSPEGEYVGGVLAPGIEISMEALFARAARLVTVDYAAPATVIGKTTVAGLQSGLVYGFAGQVDGIATRIRAELAAPEAPVVATGGLAELVAPFSATIAEVDPFLTLEGLRLVWELNRDAD